MLFITYNQNSGGRSGHKLCDIFTTFILANLLNMHVIYNSSWKNQLIISEKSLKKYSFNNKYNIDYTLEINNVRDWKSVSFEEYKKLKNQLQELSIKYENILLKISNVYKIHAHTIYDWYLNKLIDKDIYNLKLVPTLRKLYFEDNNDDIIDSISIHIRRGDLADKLINYGFNFSYYKNMIDTINDNLDVKINVYCENSRYSDILELKNCKNTVLYLGGTTNFDKHFNNMVRSKVLIISPSSLCLFAAILNKGTVLVDNKVIKWRYNIFNKVDLVFDSFDNISEKIELIKKQFKFKNEKKNKCIKNFFTFGAGPQKYIDMGNKLTTSAKNTNLFNQVNFYTDKDLKDDTEFWNKHGKFIENNKRGYGYWIWKPYLIKKTIDKMNDGDILLYLDSDSSINVDKKENIEKIFEIVKTDLILGTINNGKHGSEITWCKKDLLLKIKLLNWQLYLAQRQSGLNFFYVCDKVRKLVNEWYEISCDYHMIDDSPSISKNYRVFWEHRHDQSVFSVLTKKYRIFSSYKIFDTIFNNVIENK
jgi:hypothetical protein